jgi:hypothetical protein
MRSVSRERIRAIAGRVDPFTGLTRFQEYTRDNLEWDHIMWNIEREIALYDEHARTSILYVDGASGLRRETHSAMYYQCWKNQQDFKKDSRHIREAKVNYLTGEITRSEYHSLALRTLDPHYNSVVYMPEWVFKLDKNGEVIRKKDGTPEHERKFRAVFLEDAVDEMWDLHIQHRDDEIKAHTESRDLADEVRTLATSVGTEKGWSIKAIRHRLEVA